MVFIPHPCFLWPMEACQSPGPGSRESGKMDKEALNIPNNLMCLANTHPLAHCEKMLAAASGQMFQDLGAFIYNLKKNGKTGNRNLGWPTRPQIIPQTPSISPNWSFVVTSTSENAIVKMRCSECPTDPQHSSIYCLHRRCFVS